jgi:MSHA pilin protein MshC
MCAKSSERPAGHLGGLGRRQRGFTLVELIAILLLLGVLAVVAMPKLDGALAARTEAAHDEAVSALRYASQTAQSHRRLVCADVSATGIALRIATNRGATACDTALRGPDGSASYTANASGAAFTLSPSGTVYFQPDGRATSDGAGATASSRALAIANATGITIVGETGFVR